MKILLIHNNYGIYTGEEAVVDKQIALFHELGHTVSLFHKTTEGFRGTLIGDIKGFMQGFYSPSSVKEIKKAMKVNKPDVVVIHNLYPYISPAVLKPIKEAGVPIIMTVHNYRLICPTGLFMRDCKPCETCLEKRNEWPCIRYNCENSFVRSLGYAGRNWYARVTNAYKDHVDYYACITYFQTKKLVQAGFDKKKMIHIPNFLESRSMPETVLGNYIAVSGRISKEKGIDLILDVAKRTPHIRYVFAGIPREEDDLIKDFPPNCSHVGHLSNDKLAEFYQKSRFMVIASRWYEGFPMTVLDAYSYGKAVIGPGHAGFLEIIKENETGLLFSPGDSEDLQRKIETLWNKDNDSIEYGKNAYKRLVDCYSLPVVKKSWEVLFNKVR